MKKFEFTLGKMKDYKDRLLDQEKAMLGRLQAEKAAVDRHIESLEAEFARIAAEMEQKKAQGMMIAELIAYNAHLDNIRMHLRQLFRDQAEAQNKVDRQMEAVLSASREVSKLEKLEERQLETYREEVKREDALHTEELVVTDVTRRHAG